MTAADLKSTHRVQLVPPKKDKDTTQFAVIAWLVNLFISPVMLMFGFGTAHDLWPALIPAAGYWQSFILLVGVNSFRRVQKRWWER